MAPRAKARAASSKGNRQIKIVVTGPFGAGKTTLINTMSEIEVLSTEKKVTDATGKVKKHTTVAMDFGRLAIDAELSLYLFGTPGQKRFDFMWDILAEGMLGFIVLVDATRDDSYAEAEEILSYFRDAADVPYVVAVNKGADEADGGVGETRARLGLDDGVRCAAVDARDKESVKQVILELLYCALDDVEAAEAQAV
jgi:small GTP-binding protein